MGDWLVCCWNTSSRCEVEEVATIRLEVAPPRRQLARCRNTEHRQLDRIHLLDLPIVNATKEIPIRS